MSSILTIVGQNPSNSYILEYKVSPLDQHGNRTQRLIDVEELPHLHRGIDHLSNYKAYHVAYRAWEEALTLKRKYNDLYQELIQELKKLIVEKMHEHFRSFHEYESTQSPAIQDYFHSEGLVNVIIGEIKYLEDPDLKVDFERMFKMVEGNLVDGQWWLLERMGNTLLHSRRHLTSRDEKQLSQVLIDIESNSKIIQMVRELSKLNLEIKERTLKRFKDELKLIIEKINDSEGNYIIQGKCDLGY